MNLWPSCSRVTITVALPAFSLGELQEMAKVSASSKTKIFMSTPYKLGPRTLSPPCVLVPRGGPELFQKAGIEPATYTAFARFALPLSYFWGQDPQSPTQRDTHACLIYWVCLVGAQESNLKSPSIFACCSAR
jgi:hypothetical protein